MKLILLLISVYSLIIHQSTRSSTEKEKVKDEIKTEVKEILPVEERVQQPDFVTQSFNYSIFTMMAK